MKCITVGREFGSGGREFGQKLAEKLGFAYYDRAIITEIAQKTDLSEDYIDRILEKKPSQIYPFQSGATFSLAFDPNIHLSNSLYAQQTNIIRDMASRSDCVIVGRCADYILKDSKPFRIFVYSDRDSRINRCRKNAPENENLSDKELWKKIQAVDKDRRKYYDFFTGGKWGDKQEYDLCINTAVATIDEWVNFVAEIVKKL